MMTQKLEFLLLFTMLAVHAGSCAADEIQFGRDVLPILSDRCFHCHGPDESHREAELRLDLQAEATKKRGDYAVVVPGNVGASELMARIKSQDPDFMMPPPDSNRKALTAAEIQILESWIEAGAPWGKHWAFEAPQRPPLPVKGVHPIDSFVRARLVREGVPWSEPAERHTLLRRVTFDLTGLPPTPAELHSYLSDKSPDAFEKVVSRLLRSPHYGERMAVWWLDAARYSDTDGYQGDATRTNWPWRDWVIHAFNKNMPFDQFTIQQFAGDLLPKATQDQILATGFHRNHMTNGEGGRDPEESRIDYVIDRVNSTGTVWLGLTLGCCQCHSHKFDPITQDEYYQLFAFFNSIDEDGRAGGGAKPYLNLQSPLAKRSLQEAEQLVASRKPQLEKARAAAEQEFQVWLKEQAVQVKDGFQAWHPLSKIRLSTVEGTKLQRDGDGCIQASGPNPRQDDYRIVAETSLKRVTGLRLEVLPHATHTAGKLSRGKSGEFILTDVKLQVRRKGESQLRDLEFNSAVADAEKGAKGRNYGKVRDTLDDDPRNGWTTESHDPTKRHFAIYALAEPLELTGEEELVFVMLHRSTRGDANIGRFRLAVTDQPGPAVRSISPMPLEQLANAMPEDLAKLDGKIRKRLLDQFLTDHQPYQEAKQHFDRAQGQFNTVRRAAGKLNVMVLGQRKSPRKTHVLERGVWDKKGKEVPAGVPAAVLARPNKETRTRLDLARWIVDRQNPLTARVVVNHLWQMCFGAGLVRTPEDFGLQGENPTHPKLLDWLAVELMENDWDIQHLLRLIVTSETYQQSSVATSLRLERDPENKLLARGARFRLPSWMIRDAALRSSGLLNPAIGGPPVMPYQPPGVWAEMFMGRFRYQPSQGPAQYRRTVYAFWRRAAAPTFLFDSAQRRVCEVRPRRTNTPLHALTLLNDESILESARALARTAMAQQASVEQRLKNLFVQILSRPPQDAELQVVLREFSRALKHYQEDREQAGQLLDFGQLEQRPAKAENHPELAAYMVVASLIYNLDEAITHE